ncbi:unnamed protein product [Auanema sp. JU1783]|nr:unnamed protein product [Auanema sp. JU1783]
MATRLFVLISSFALLVHSAPATGNEVEGSGELPCDTDGFINWDYRHVPKKPEVVEVIETIAATPNNAKLCPNGWISYRESCYSISSDQLAMDKAERACNDLETALFVPDTVEEFDTIRVLAPQNNQTWLGLTGSTCLQWQTKGGMDFELLNHKLKSEDRMSACETKCFAHMNAEEPKEQFTHFYDCTNEFYYICERNATLYATLN